MKKDWKDRDNAADHSFSGIERDEFSGRDIIPEVAGDNIRKGTSRRDFLKVLGYSFASAAILASCKRPIINALPYVVQPPELTPGKALYYASTFYDGHEYAGILVKTRDGRPIKMNCALSTVREPQQGYRHLCLVCMMIQD